LRRRGKSSSDQFDKIVLGSGFAHRRSVTEVVIPV
jgi:hypothetical protein